eukprot:COSAG02_NODE_35038_length_474_cov_134.088000_1_plen_44_part_10
MNSFRRLLSVNSWIAVLRWKLIVRFSDTQNHELVQPLTGILTDF